MKPICFNFQLTYFFTSLQVFAQIWCETWAHVFKKSISGQELIDLAENRGKELIRGSLESDLPSTNSDGVSRKTSSRIIFHENIFNSLIAIVNIPCKTDQRLTIFLSQSPARPPAALDGRLWGRQRDVPLHGLPSAARLQQPRVRIQRGRHHVAAPWTAPGKWTSSD